MHRLSNGVGDNGPQPVGPRWRTRRIDRRDPRQLACRAGGQCSGTTSTRSWASTPAMTWTRTWCSPTVLIGSRRWMSWRSTSIPSCRSRSAMSRVVTDPNSRSLLAGLDPDLDGQLIQALGEGLGICPQRAVAVVPLLAVPLPVADRAEVGQDRGPGRDQVVAGVPVLDVLEVALPAEPLHVALEDDLHLRLLGPGSRGAPLRDLALHLVRVPQRTEPLEQLRQRVADPVEPVPEQERSWARSSSRAGRPGLRLGRGAPRGPQPARC